MFDKGCLSKSESRWGYGFALAIFIGCALLSMSLAGCTSTQRDTDPLIELVCPEADYIELQRCQKTANRTDNQLYYTKAALDRCEDALNVGLSKSR